ncbi:hypothetical protein G6F22_017435 [Rhizopus arrhizus]|nr:hypothetical protein G6F22_017435 [Rhizopus arrhizus]
MVQARHGAALFARCHVRQPGRTADRIGLAHAYPGQPAAHRRGTGLCAIDRCTARAGDWQLAAAGGRGVACHAVPAHDLAAFLDADCGDGVRRGRRPRLFPADLRGGLAHRAEHRGWRAAAGSSLAATGPKRGRHALGDLAQRDPARRAGPYPDRGAPGHRHSLDRAGALRNAGRVCGNGIFHPGHA